MSENCRDKDVPGDSTIRLASLGNFGIGVAGIFVGVITLSSAALADGVHNLADSWAHKIHRSTSSAEAAGDISKTNSLRTRAGVLIGAGALLIGAYSVYEIVNREQNESLNVPALIVEFGAVGLNGLVAYKFWKDGKQEATGHKHSRWHNNVDFGTSVVAATGIALNPVFAGADGVAGLAASAATGVVAYKIGFDKAH